MPYNTTAIPPRKEVTGQAQLPLSRVKKIVSQDQDINICSNNAAFVITLATEMFIQYLAEEGLNMAKLERKPRRNIQYKDLANAVSHQDNLQFLEDIIPKTVPYKQIKAHAAATRANLSSGTKTTAGGNNKSKTTTSSDPADPRSQQPNGKKHKSSSGNRQRVSGASIASFVGASGTKIVSEENGDDNDTPMDPNEQLQDEMRKAANAVSRGNKNGHSSRKKGGDDEDIEMEG